MPDSPSIWNRLRGLFGKENPEARKTPTESTPKDNPKSRPSAQNTTPLPNAAPLSKASISQKPGSSLDPKIPTPVVDLVFGIDLGTSCTKVVIGDPGWQDKSFAVSFGSSRKDISSWFHPTRFGSEANLKMRLMDNPDGEEIRDLLACNLAEVINHSRSWFDANRPKNYSTREIRWSLNLGYPDKAVGNTPLSNAYRDIAAMAVTLASGSEKPSMELAAGIRRSGFKGDAFIPSTRIQLYPEIAAQLAGYVNSPYRQSGNLLLIDVGAGTLDISTIILHGDRESEVVSFHFCDVAPLGVLRLYQARTAACDQIKPGCVKYPVEHFQDGSLAVPETLSSIVHQSSSALQSGFVQVSTEMGEKVVRVALACLTRFRKSQREAHSSANFDPWGNNLRFFLTGGGCRSAFFQGQLADGPLEDQLAPYTRWHRESISRKAHREGLRLEPLPLPDNLENFPTVLRLDFDRLSVAYGLAYGGENLMRITTSVHS